MPWEILVLATAGADLRWAIENLVSGSAELQWDVAEALITTAHIRLRWPVRATWAIPVADVTRGGWDTEGVTLDLDEADTRQPYLYEALDAYGVDSSRIVSSRSPGVTDVCEVALGELVDPAVSTGHVVSYRYAKSATTTQRIDMAVRLMQGSTEIAAWSHTDISATITEAAQTLTAAQADAITDYTDLRLRFETTHVVS